MAMLCLATGADRAAAEEWEKKAERGEEGINSNAIVVDDDN